MLKILLMLSAILMLTACYSTNTPVVVTKIEIVCAGEVIYFQDAEEVKATPAPVKRQILANNLAVDKCKEMEMGSTQRPVKQGDEQEQEARGSTQRPVKQ